MLRPCASSSQSEVAGRTDWADVMVVGGLPPNSVESWQCPARIVPPHNGGTHDRRNPRAHEPAATSDRVQLHPQRHALRQRRRALHARLRIHLGRRNPAGRPGRAAPRRAARYRGGWCPARGVLRRPVLQPDDPPPGDGRSCRVRSVAQPRLHEQPVDQRPRGGTPAAAWWCCGDGGCCRPGGKWCSGRGCAGRRAVHRGERPGQGLPPGPDDRRGRADVRLLPGVPSLRVLVVPHGVHRRRTVGYGMGRRVRQARGRRGVRHPAHGRRPSVPV